MLQLRLQLFARNVAAAAAATASQSLFGCHRQLGLCGNIMLILQIKPG